MPRKTKEVQTVFMTPTEDEEVLASMITSSLVERQRVIVACNVDQVKGLYRKLVLDEIMRFNREQG